MKYIPEIVQEDKTLYEILFLIDALRIGKAREKRLPLIYYRKTNGLCPELLNEVIFCVLSAGENDTMFVDKIVEDLNASATHTN